MREFRIKIYNGSDILVDDATLLIKASDENAALVEYLENVSIYSGDTIHIEEI